MRRKTIVGDIYKTNQYGDCQIIELTSITHCKVRFLLTGYEKIVERGELKRGRVRDPFYPIYYGVGFTGSEMSYKSKEYNKIRSLWSGMLERCYDKKSEYYYLYGGNNVTVDDRWFNLENFIQDIKLFENYDKWLNKTNPYEWQLDKDYKCRLLGLENKIYSKDTCMFATSEMQSIFQLDKKIIGYVNGIETFRFDSMSQAGRSLNLSSAGIRLCVNKKTNHTGKYNNIPIVWRYEGDLDIDYIENNQLFNGFVEGILVFKSITIKEAVEVSSLNSYSGIYNCAKYKLNYAGFYKSKPITWRYIEDNNIPNVIVNDKGKSFIGKVNGNVIFKYKQAIDAEKELKIHATSIIKCCKGKSKSAGKYEGVPINWEYVEV